MNKLLTLLFALLLSVGTAEVYSQDYGSYLQTGKEHFDAGRYESAQKALAVYCKLTGKAETEFEQKICICIEYVRLAEQAEKEQKYKEAIDWYNKVVQINPNDNGITSEISRLTALNKSSSPILQATSPSVEVKEVQKHHVRKNIFKPQRGGFSMMLLSSFERKGPLGMGIYFNRSYFQFGLDFVLSNEFADASGIDTDKIYLSSEQELISEKFFLIDESEILAKDGRLWKVESNYVYPRAQLTVSPGINLKYLSVNCGLGVFLCEDLNMTHYLIQTDGMNEYMASMKVKPYFLVRPTIIGYIPIGRNHNGMSVSLGYNIVPGAKPMNGFLFGIGFFI
ncbi:MAG: tetratricopeptide repeat protein [Clostridium sp.]|nr:tetratricopeptide repeat protein [Clostridium sp.]